MKPKMIFLDRRLPARPLYHVKEFRSTAFLKHRVNYAYLVNIFWRASFITFHVFLSQNCFLLISLTIISRFKSSLIVFGSKLTSKNQLNCFSLNWSTKTRQQPIKISLIRNKLFLKMNWRIVQIWALFWLTLTQKAFWSNRTLKRKLV